MPHFSTAPPTAALFDRRLHMTQLLESGLEKIGRVLADKYGIRVVCQGNRCATDGKTIYLPSLPDDLPKDLERAIHSFLDHEIAHTCGKSDFKIGAKFRAKHGATAFGILNCLEDLRVERVMAERFPGSSANLAYGYRYAHAMAKKAVEEGEEIPIAKQVAIALCTRGKGIPDWPMVADDVYARVDPITPLLRKAEQARNTACHGRTSAPDAKPDGAVPRAVVTRYGVRPSQPPCVASSRRFASSS